MLLLVTIFTWGSVGSAVCSYCLIIMGAALLRQKFLINEEDSDYDMD